LAYWAKVGGSLALNDLLDRCITDSTRLTLSVVDFTLHREVALFTFAIDKIT
jgi:hypothetical protein